jgi:hypothetical protein
LYTTANRNPRVDPVMGMGPRIDPDETFFAFDVPVTYRIDENLAAEFGGIVTTRAPHFRSDQFELHNTEVWGYVAFRFAMGTARGAREVERRDGPIGTGAQQLGIGAGGLNTDRVTRRQVRAANPNNATPRRRQGEDVDPTMDRRRRMMLERERLAPEDDVTTPVQDDVGPPAVMPAEPTPAIEPTTDEPPPPPPDPGDAVPPPTTGTTPPPPPPVEIEDRRERDQPDNERR